MQSTTVDHYTMNLHYESLYNIWFEDNDTKAIGLVLTLVRTVFQTTNMDSCACTFAHFFCHTHTFSFLFFFKINTSLSEVLLHQQPHYCIATDCLQFYMIWCSCCICQYCSLISSFQGHVSERPGLWIFLQLGHWSGSKEWGHTKTSHWAKPVSMVLWLILSFQTHADTLYHLNSSPSVLLWHQW